MSTPAILPRLAILAMFFVACFAVLMIAPSVSAADSCALCNGAQTLDCLSCAGKGFDLADYRWCKGKGREMCALCGRVAEYVKKKYACETCNGKSKSCKKCGGVVRHMSTAKGKLPCSNVACYNGTVKTTAYTMRCAMCRGSNRSLDCSFCKDGTQVCGGCTGKKQVPVGCYDCAASGKVRCPLCYDPKQGCPMCKDSKKVACMATPDPSHPKVTCGKCWGVGDDWCGDCYGLGRVACEDCLGTGTQTLLVVKKYTNEPVGKGGRSKCETCKKRGTVACGRCEKGRLECKSCKKGIIEGHCFLCQAVGTYKCSGCQPRPFRAFQESAIVLLESGEFAKAVDYLVIAVEKAETHYRSVLADDELEKDQEVAVEEERDETLERLRYLLETARVEAGLDDE